jgi:hypothetical protein
MLHKLTARAYADQSVKRPCFLKKVPSTKKQLLDFVKKYRIQTATTPAGIYAKTPANESLNQATFVIFPALMALTQTH